MKNKEIERKFLIEPEKIPFDLEKLDYCDMVQGYVTSVDKELTFRLRHVLYKNTEGVPTGEKWFQTLKGKGSKIRDEYEIELSKEQFSTMWKMCERLSLHKFRYEIKQNFGTIHLDRYKNGLKGLWTLEVEFDTLQNCDDFVPLDWFGEEVTENMDYTNLSMAINGLPEKISK